MHEMEKLRVTQAFCKSMEVEVSLSRNDLSTFCKLI